jgi:exonuclease III
VRGLNSDKKWNSIRDKIVESKCDIVCLQETKKEQFDSTFIRNICPQHFDSFTFKPSQGASGGILVCWNGRIFNGLEIFQNEIAIIVEFSSNYNREAWLLTTVYAPCTPNGKRAFLNWFKNIQIPDDREWLVIGDFNLIRRPEDRNKVFLFNEVINTLGLT